MEETLIKRVMPNSLEAEQSVIGSMIMDQDAIVTAMEILLQEDFYHKQYGILFDAMIELYSSGQPVDLVTLQNKLKEKDVPQEVSSLEFVGELVRAVPTSANVKYYCNIVKENSMKRKLIRVTEEIENECYAGKESLESVLDKTEHDIFALLSSRTGGDYVPIRQVVMNALEKIEKASQQDGNVTGIPTGFIDLDYRTAGLQPSDLVLIAARPSMGKTAFVLNIAQYVAFHENMCTAIFSLEMSKEQARGILSQANYFGTMLVKMGIADALLGGATYSTADTVRPALQLIKTKPGNSIVSSCFILVRPSATGENEVLAMSDCAINIHPTEDELVEIAGESAACARIFGVDPKVAFLSYSTLGSGKGEDVDKMRNAAHKAREKYPDLPIEGELQFDAAVSPRVARTKCPDSSVAGHANTFIFPDINAGNIGYKIAQRLGNFEAYGPILLGLNAPINDLSRGCNASEVYSMAIITAALA